MITTINPVLQRILNTSSIYFWLLPAWGSFHTVKPEACTLTLIFQAIQGHSPVKVIDGTCQLLVLLLAHCYESSIACSNVTLGKELNTGSKMWFGLMMVKVKLQWDDEEALAYTASPRLRGENSPECSNSGSHFAMGGAKTLISR